MHEPQPSITVALYSDEREGDLQLPALIPVSCCHSSSFGRFATKHKRESRKVDDNTSAESIHIDTDGIVEELTNTIGAKLLNHSPLPASCCIFRVPHPIRRKKIQAYEPDIVSIGPLHRGRGGDKFQLMEKVKRWYLQCLLNQRDVKNTTSEGNAASLPDLVLNFFKQSVADDFIFKPCLNLPHEPLHILDLIRTWIVFPCKEEGLGCNRKVGSDDQQQSEERSPPQRVPNATTLSEAGIKFQKSFKTSDCIMNINFDNGVFTIPPLGIDETTGPLFRNLIAFEQCCHSRPHRVTSYAVLMDNLIDSSKDIDLLCDMGILVNWLSPEDAARFFNELYNDTMVNGFYYEGLCNNVNEYYKTDWNKWMEKLRREHFGTPWAIISLVAAFILLVLTLQTVYAIHQFYHPPK